MNEGKVIAATVELIKLIFEAIDRIRNLGDNATADYLDNKMQELLNGISS